MEALPFCNFCPLILPQFRCGVCRSQRSERFTAHYHIINQPQLRHRDVSSKLLPLSLSLALPWMDLVNSRTITNVNPVYVVALKWMNMMSQTSYLKSLYNNIITERM